MTTHPITKEAMDQRWNEFESKLIDALVEKGHEVGVKEGSDGASRMIKTVDGRFISIEHQCERRNTVGIRANYTGRLRYTITNGAWGKSSSYPEPKNGFSVSDAVERVLESVNKEIKVRKSREDRINREAAAEATFDRAMAAIGKEDGMGYYAQYGPHYISVKASTAQRVKVDCSVTPEQLARLIELVNEG